MTRPKTETPDAKTGDAKTGETKPGMSEAFFEALTTASNYGVQFANRILVACP